MRSRALVLVPLLLSPLTAAEERSTDAYVDQTRDRWISVARKIWETPETGLQEKKSSQALAEVLQKEGFKVTWGIGGEPTAFVATAGSGTPTVALLAEYDALPGLSQKAGLATKSALVEGGAGHGCGHNLFGTASTAAAIAANRERQARKLPGTLQLFGTPAEEIGIGKTFMLRDGAFKSTDVALTWHPDDQNRVVNRTRLALASTEVEFFGRSAHAAIAPWAGRSALDALVLFDHAMALMREHIKPTARMHRVFKEGGQAANVIPDHTRAEYWVRDETWERVQELLGRLRKAAEGAAIATETRVQLRLIHSNRDVVPNGALDAVLQKELERVGPPAYDAQDIAFAKGLQKEVGADQVGMAQKVSPYTLKNGFTGSSDIGEVSAALPLSELGVATIPLGVPLHQWATTSCSAHPIGYKGMLVAARVLAASAVDLLSDPSVVAAAKEDFRRATAGKPYQSPLAPDAKPQTSR